MRLTILLVVIALGALTLTARAQTPAPGAAPPSRGFGRVEVAACTFELAGERVEDAEFGLHGGVRDGFPIGVQVVARPWREDVAFAAGRVIEKALGGWQPPPL